MIGFKFLRSDGTSPFTGFRWPLPDGTPGAWVDAEVDPCRSGIHACRQRDLPLWLGRRLFEVELAGTIVETSPGSEAAKPLGPGSYYMQPSVVHRTQCTAAADCYVYIYEPGHFSFTPTDENGKPLPPQPKAK